MNQTSFIPLSVHILSVCLCLGCSALYHWFWIKDRKTAARLARLDYSGISIVIFGTTVPIASYGMSCNAVHVPRRIFFIAIGIACICCTIVSISPGFDLPKYRKWRGIMFMILGIMTSGLFLVFWIWPEECLKTNILLWVLGGYLCIQGAVIYVLRVPERWAPGTFDIFGSSHQIFHAAVVFSCMVTVYLNYKAYVDRQNFLGCPIWSN